VRNSIESVLFPALGVCAVLCLLSAVLAIPGVSLGLKRKLVIYDGRDDLNEAWDVLVAVVAALIALNFHFWIGGALLVLSFLLLTLSIRRTYRANKSFGKSLLAVPTKFAVLGLIVVCGLLSFSVVAGLHSFAEKKHKEGAKQLAAGAAGLVGFGLLKKLITKLVRETRSRV